jgi:hypothetical protein
MKMTKKFRSSDLECLFVYDKTPLEMRVVALEVELTKLAAEFNKFKYLYRAMADDD